MSAALLGTIAGGLFTLLGSVSTQLIVNARQKEFRQREEVLPIASRALRAAQQSWIMLVGHAVAVTYPDQKGPTGESAGGYLKRWDDEYRELEIALEELSLLVPNIEAQNQQLIEALKLGTLLPGRQHGKQEKIYRAARNAVQKRLRNFLGTKAHS